MNRFVVYGANRSGSHHLQSLLHSHPQMNCYWDIFWHHGKSEVCLNTFLAQRGSSRLPRFIGRRRAVSEFLEDHYRKSDGMLAAGFLLKWGAADRYPEILTWLKANGGKVVHLVRQNLLTHLVAIRLREAGLVTGHARTSIELRPVWIDPATVVHRLHASQRYLTNQRRRLRNHDVLEIAYEALINDEERTLARIQAFIGVPGATLTTEFTKTESEQPQEMIENFSEIRDVLGQTEFARYLEPGKHSYHTAGAPSALTTRN